MLSNTLKNHMHKSEVRPHQYSVWKIIMTVTTMSTWLLRHQQGTHIVGNIGAVRFISAWNSRNLAQQGPLNLRSLQDESHTAFYASPAYRHRDEEKEYTWINTLAGGSLKRKARSKSLVQRWCNDRSCFISLPAGITTLTKKTRSRAYFPQTRVQPTCDSH